VTGAGTASSQAETDAAMDTNGVELELTADDRLDATARLVLGGLASRAGFDAAALGDLRAVVDGVLRLRPAERTVVFRASETAAGLKLVAGPFAESSPRTWIAVTLTRRAGTQGSR
jgi:hypothetical protein